MNNIVLEFSVEEFLQSLCLSTYKHGYVSAKVAEILKQHPLFEVEFFLKPSDTSGYFIFDKYGWSYENDKLRYSTNGLVESSKHKPTRQRHTNVNRKSFEELQQIQQQIRQAIKEKNYDLAVKLGEQL